MKQRIGVCTHFGNCSTADSKKKMPMIGDESFCPTCGSQLTEYKTSNYWLPVFLGLFILVIFVFSISFLIWQFIINSNDNSYNSSFLADNKKTPLLNAERSSCLLNVENQNEHLMVENIQQKLPMTYVPALKHHPIPHDLQPWIKQMTQISESGFFIMRREVTVGDLKDYVLALSEQQLGQYEQQQGQLGQYWQQDRHGAPLPDDYPAGSISWIAAMNYAQWLSQLTACRLTLPTYHQWVSAVVQYAQPEQTILRQHQQTHFLRPTPRPEIPDKIVDLLGNLREWSSENRINDQVCPNNGYYILGEDYKTWLQYISGEPHCETMALDTVGFRLVWMK